MKHANHNTPAWRYRVCYRIARKEGIGFLVSRISDLDRGKTKIWVAPMRAAIRTMEGR